jgi:hypothetical protein
MSTEPTSASESTALSKITAILAKLTDLHKKAPAGIAGSAPQMTDLLAGRQRVAVNAIKHGVTGLKTFLSDDEFLPYMQIARDFILELRPATSRDAQLAQKIIDNNWRINRLSALETNMMVTGLIKRSKDHVQQDPGTQEIISQVLAYEEDCAGRNCFDKLGRHEMRLYRIADQLEKTYDRRLLRRMRQLGERPQFDSKTNPAYQWYQGMMKLAEELETARKELAAAAQIEARADLDQTLPAASATAAESATSESHLFCETPAAKPAPELPKLTEIAVRALTFALENGYLRNQEADLFKKMTAA